MVSPIKSNSETNPWFDEVARPQETNSALEKERDALVEKFKCHETAVVITSYSIHYTKLYELRIHQRRNNQNQYGDEQAP